MRQPRPLQSRPGEGGGGNPETTGSDCDPGVNTGESPGTGLPRWGSREGWRSWPSGGPRLKVGLRLHRTQVWEENPGLGGDPRPPPPARSPPPPSHTPKVEPGCTWLLSISRFLPPRSWPTWQSALPGPLHRHRGRGSSSTSENNLGAHCGRVPRRPATIEERPQLFPNPEPLRPPAA